VQQRKERNDYNFYIFPVPDYLLVSIKNLLKRIIKYIPAVIKVDECIRAETGVEAAITKGNHTEKETWAFLVITNIINNMVLLKSSHHEI